MFTRDRPASLSCEASPGRRSALVVRETSGLPDGPCRAVSRRTTSTMSTRSSGSPPVNRISVIPNETPTRATCTISSVLSIVERASHGTPSAGMQ